MVSISSTKSILTCGIPSESSREIISSFRNSVAHEVGNELGST